MFYTAITSTFDELQDPIVEGEYLAFSKLTHPKWKSVNPTSLFLDRRRNARFHKILMPETDCVWIDGNIMPKVTEKELFEILGDDDILVHKHAFRDCVYQEAATIQLYKLDSPTILAEQLTRYKNEGYPEHNGMVETGILVRKNNERVRNFNRIWWEEICRGSKRDQMSFNYCLSKCDVKVKYIEENIRESSLVTLKEHNR